MIDDSLRRRLESLNRGPIPIASHKDATPAQNSSPAKSTAPMNTTSAPRQIAGLLRSGETVETSLGQHLRIRLPMDSLWPTGRQLVAARQDFLLSHVAAARQAIEPSIVLNPEFASLVAALPDRTIALDLETCGLAGSALFLIGMLRQVDGQPTVELLLARNYAEEAAVLASLWQTLPNCDVMLTFNGKSFDWPMVLERSIRHRLPTVGWAPPTKTQIQNAHLVGGPHPTKVHIDVLHHARRRWRKHLPNCRLQTLEWHVCRRHRAADIPSHCIPAVYADYVRTGFERDMDTVLHHNALDLVTLFDLALRLAA
jgi:uncharacterized protein YprB with RNaseH-like and TPR domain